MGSIFIDIYQQLRINQAKQEAEFAKEKVISVEEKIAEIERRCERLSLACQAMWELLRERQGLSDQEIEEKILEVDMRDGRVDGKMSRTIVKCSSCGRNSNSTKSMCIYCGVAISKTNVFER